MEALVLWHATLTERGLLVAMTPWLIFGGGAAVLLCAKSAGPAEHISGITALSLSMPMMILVGFARPGSCILKRIRRLKRWGTEKQDLFWWVADSGVGCSVGIGMIANEVVLRALANGATEDLNDDVQLCAGVLYLISAIAGVMSHTSGTDMVSLLRCSGGLIVWSLAGIMCATSKTFPAPGTALAASAMLASASVRLLPGVAQQAQQLIHINIELQPLQDGKDSKFTAGKMVFGRGGPAAQGLELYLCLSPQDIAKGLSDGIHAMECEIRQSGDEDDLDNFKYVAERCSLTPEHIPKKIAETLRCGVYHGGAITPDEFDKGHGGRTLSDWMQLDEIKIAQLSDAEFVAVRFYTSPSFWRINGPLRRGEKHPWPMVVMFLSSGIKKLRTVQAQLNPERFATETTLWRGMKNLEMDMHEFRAVGGTELAPMSTTTSEDVAKHYAESKVPLVFKYKVSGLKAGVCIQFLSLYPKEQEYVYPPLTFLTYRNHFTDDGMMVVVVEPVMS